MQHGFFESAKGGQDSFEYRLSPHAADVIDWMPAMKSFHRESTATSTAPSRTNRGRKGTDVAKSAHSGLDLKALVTTGALMSQLSVNSFQTSRIPFLTSWLPNSFAHVGIGPSAGIGLLPFSLTSNYELLLGVQATTNLEANLRMFIDCVSFQSAEFGVRWGRVLNYVSLDSTQYTHSILFDMLQNQGNDDAAKRPGDENTASPRVETHHRFVDEFTEAPAPSPGKAGDKKAAANKKVTRGAAVASAVKPSAPAQNEIKKEEPAAPLQHTTRWPIRSFRTGLGVVVRRQPPEGVNLWWGAAADITESTHMASQINVLRQWSTSLHSSIDEWNLRLAARLRMNVITFKSTVIDFGIAHNISEHITLRASTSTSGVAVGLTGRDCVRHLVVPCLEACGERGVKIGEVIQKVTDSFLAQVDVTAGVLSRYPQKPVASGFLVLHTS